jgi:hypothetical protein
MSNYRKTMADALREMYPLTEETQLDEGVFDPKDGEKWAKEIQKGIKAPVVDVKTSSLGGEERMSIMVKFSMEKEASKGGTAFFNSRYANVRVDIDGSMEMFQASHKFGIKKMRKAKIKSAKDVIKNINDWIVKVPALKEEVDLDEALKVGQKVKVKDKGKVVSGVITNVGKGQTLGVADVKLPDGRINVYGTDEINEEVDLDEASKEGTIKIIKTKDGKFQIQKMTKGKFVDMGKPYNSAKEAEKFRSGQPDLFGEASAAADARRAISKDRDFGRKRDSADKDDVASDDDVKAASKNIMMQLRKSVNRASRGVEFGDKKKVQVDPKIAQAVISKYNSLRRPSDKEIFQAKIAKSYKDMLKALKESTIKESKFGIINKQLKGEK